MHRTSLVTLALCAALAACSKPAPAPTAPPAAASSTPAAKPAAPPPKLTAEQTAKLESDFTAARKIIEQARALREEGNRIEKEKGFDAANPTLYRARKEYQKAIRMTETWVEPEVGVITAGQLATYLQSWSRERETWIAENSSMGSKIHE